MTEPPDTPQADVLILGVTGQIGHAIGAALSKRGYRIRALTRRVNEAKVRAPFVSTWFAGDAMDADAVAHASKGAALIVHAVNPPGYTRWREAAVPMLRNTIKAALEEKATIVFPANVYVFGPSSPAVVDEATPFAPTTEKGRIRVEMEAMIEAACQRGARAIIVRAGDFFGPGYENSWFRQAMAKGGRSATAIQTLTAAGIGHAWAYLPDLGETFARLIDRRDSLAAFERVHFAGHHDGDGRRFADAIRRVLGKPSLPIKAFAWWQVALATPFVTFLREVWRMRWLWRHPLKLDNTKLARLIGAEPHTPLDAAIAASLD